MNVGCVIRVHIQRDFLKDIFGKNVNVIVHDMEGLATA